MSSPTDGPVLPAVPAGRAPRRVRRPPGRPGPATGRRRHAARRLAAAAAPPRAAGARPAGRRPARRQRRDDGGARRPAARRRAGPSRPAAGGRAGDVTVVSRSGTGRPRSPGCSPPSAPIRPPRDLPVVVVDDGSAVPVRGAGARVLRHDSARGPAAARNAGLRAARTPPVAFLDSDCVPRAGWLQPLLPHLADPRLAVVAPRIVPLPGRPRLAGPVRGRGQRARHGPSPAPVRPRSGVSYVPSAALLVRRAALGDGFDETMRVAEDVDLVWRLAAAGWRVRYEPAAAVAHEHPADDGGVAAAPGVLRHRAPPCWPPGTAARSPRWSSRRTRRSPGAGGGRPGDGPGGGGRRPRRRHRAAGPRLARPGERPPVGVRGRARRPRDRGVRPGAGPRGHPAPLAARPAGGAGLPPRPALGARRRRGGRVAAWWPHRRAGGTGPFRRGPAPGGPRLRRRALVGRRPGAGRAGASSGASGMSRYRNALVAVGTADCANDGPASSTQPDEGPRDRHPGTAGRGRRTARRDRPGPGWPVSRSCSAASWPSAR